MNTEMLGPQRPACQLPEPKSAVLRDGGCRMIEQRIRDSGKRQQPADRRTDGFEVAYITQNRRHSDERHSRLRVIRFHSPIRNIHAINKLPIMAGTAG